MRKFIRRSLVGLAAVAAAGVVLSAVAAAMFKGTPAWYRATVDAKLTDAQREQLAHSAENKMIEAQNWAATVRADAQRAQRSTAGASRPTTITARAEASYVIEFSDAELNALFDKWSMLYGWRDEYAAYLEDPRIVLRDDRLIFAGRLRELGAVASFQFRPHLDDVGQLKLDLVRVSGGRLPLPEGVWVKWRDQIVDSARKNMPAWRTRANVDPSGAANFPMMAATLSRLLFDVADRHAAEPVLFLPLAGQRDSVPVKVADVAVETGKLTLVVEPLTAAERVALLERVRAGTAANAQAAGDQPRASDMDATQQLNLARQRFQAGDLAGAESACRDVLAIEPANFDAAYIAGVISLQQNRLPDAAGLLSRAASARPDVPDAHANLGHALRGLGQFDEAATALERAIALRPNYPLAINNLGTVRRAQGRTADAIACYERAASLQSNFLPAWMNLGNVLVEVGRPAEAAQAFRTAMGLAPHNPDAQAGLAAAMEAGGDAAGAIANFEAVLRRHPNHVNALVNLSQLLKKQSRIDESVALLERAVAANANSADAHEKLGRGLWDAGFYERGLSHFERSVALRPSPVARVNAATLIPPIYRSLEEVQTWRERLVREVAILRRENVTIDVTNHIARSPFYLPYAGLPDRDVMRAIALLHRRPADPVLATRTGGRIRVGFISTLFKDHTVGLWTQGLIDKLPRDRFEIFVISTARHDDSVARFTKSRADHDVELTLSLPAARQTIAALGLDVLIYTDLGMEGFCWSLAFSRLARVQCTMWGHPETSGIGAVDYFISSDLIEAPEADADYTERLARLPNLPLYYFRPPPAPECDRAYFKLPPRAEAHLYGCLQATFKLHPEFDRVLGEILRRDSKGIILVPRTGASNWDRMVVDRIAKTYGDVVSRIRFIERVSREDFAALQTVCDATLAPFPFGAGDTSMVAFAEGVPVVTMPTAHLRGRFTHAMYGAMEIDDCVAETPEQYVEIALRLANEPAWRESVRAKILERNHVLFENMTGVHDLADFISSVAQR